MQAVLAPRLPVALELALRTLEPRRERTTTPVRGVPGVHVATIDGALVVAVDDRPLRTPVSVQLAPAYQTVSRAQRVREPRRIGDDGRTHYATVDTATYSCELTCWCGRRRYVRPNSKHQVTQCWPCTQHDKIVRRRARQRTRRTM